VLDRPNHLVISPNLDALLEHDERTRPRANSARSPYPSTTSASSGSSSAGFFVGLPPPPRGPRKTVKAGEKARDRGDRFRPTLSIYTSLEDGSTEASVGETANFPPTNPFINPAPSLEVLLKAEASITASRTSSSVATHPPPLTQASNYGDDNASRFYRYAGENPRPHDPQSHTSSDTRRKKLKRIDPQKQVGKQQAALLHQNSNPAVSRIQARKKFSMPKTLTEERANDHRQMDRFLSTRARSRSRGRLGRSKGISSSGEALKVSLFFETHWMKPWHSNCNHTRRLLAG
jgi:hypothetical protein